MTRLFKNLLLNLKKGFNFFYLPHDFLATKSFKYPFIYCLKFNGLVLFVASILIVFIDKSSNFDWLTIVKERGLIYFYPQAALLAEIGYRTLSFMPVLLVLVTIVYIIFAIEINEREKRDKMKEIYYKYFVSWLLLFCSRNIWLIFLGNNHKI